MTNRGLCFALFAALALSPAASAAVTCAVAAVPAVVSSEGLAEQVGDVVISCSGGAAGEPISGNLTLFQSVAITNRIDDGGVSDILLTVDSGAGPGAGTPATVVSLFSAAFNGLSFPLSPSGSATLRIRNLRAAVAQQGVDDKRPVTVSIAFNGPLAFNTSQVVVAVPQRGLLASSSSTAVYCVGSPLPADLTLSGLFAEGTRFTSVRTTEGHAGAFRPPSGAAANGVRIVLRYSGFPQGARLFVPDYIAGSSAAQQTAAGDLGIPRSGGAYLGGSNTLLLTRVAFANEDGSGGSAALPAPPAGVSAVFDAVGEVPLRNGSGVAVYQVMDAAPAVLESAQIPTFVVYTPPESGGNTAVAKQEVSFAPVSTVAVASVAAPVPRYVSAIPPNDCSALNDCNAAYLPRLVVDAPAVLNFTGIAGGGYSIQYIRVLNESSASLMVWTIAVEYKSGSGWLRIDNTSDFNNATVRIDALPEKLGAGTYEANLIVDAGPLAGRRIIPVRFVVSAFFPPSPQPPSVKSVVNSATNQEGPLVPGSLSTLYGSRFSGRNVAVIFDDVPARILYASEGQIHLLVPAALAGRTSARMVVKVDDLASAWQPVAVAAANPGVFGTLNQDSTVNGPANGAPAGTVIQIFVTGLPDETASTVLARVHDWDPAPPIYAGPAPGLPGVQQVNARIPVELPAMTTDVRICVRTAAEPERLVCSPPSRITIR